MGLRPTKGEEDVTWGGPPRSARVPLDPLFGFYRIQSAEPTRASAADQGVRPTYVFNGAMQISSRRCTTARGVTMNRNTT